jgi:hypothetical protein
VERRCLASLRYLSYCITPKKVTINRDPPLIEVTSGPQLQHTLATEETLPVDAICSRTI